MSNDTCGNDETKQQVTASEYVPPKVWTYEGKTTGTTWSGNRPTSGARYDKELPVGKHPIQLYSFGTPNGQKVTIMLEELLAAGAGPDAEYDAWLINFLENENFSSGFTEINPNGKIPAMVVKNDPKSNGESLNIFESGNILLYLAERFEMFLPKEQTKRIETLNWLFWQMSCGGYVGGGFGHFYAYANEKQKYPIDRYTMEVKRQLDVLEKLLAKRKYIVGDDITIADFAIFPWYGNLVLGRSYKDAEVFLNVQEEYPNVIRWAKMIDERPAVIRGRKVNRLSTKEFPPNEILRERHDASDFEVKTTTDEPAEKKQKTDE